jgi:hypothetical protein
MTSLRTLGLAGGEKAPGTLPFPRQVGPGDQSAHAVSDKIDLTDWRSVRVVKSRDVTAELPGQLFD